MSPELIAAIKERITLGYSKESIQAELKEAGYDDDSIEVAYAAAQTNGQFESNVTGAAVLPRISELFKVGFSFALSRLDLVGLLAVISVVSIITEILVPDSEEMSPLMGMGVVINLVALVFNFLVIAATVYIVSQVDVRQVPFREAFAWARKHVWSLAWVYILMSLVTMGGFMLLIVPGVIVSVLVYFSQYVYAREGVRGVNALLRSRELVQGNWGAVFGRTLGLGLLVAIIQAALTLVMMLVLSIFFGGEISQTENLFNQPFDGSVTGTYGILYTLVYIFMQVISVFFVVFGFRVGMEIYRHLSLARPVAGVVTGRGKYIALAWLGVVFPVLIIAFISFIFVATQELNYESVQETERSRDEAMEKDKDRATQLRMDAAAETEETTTQLEPVSQGADMVELTPQEAEVTESVPAELVPGV